MRERRSRETDTAVRGVKDGVETLQEGKAVYEVETRAGVRTNIVHNEVHAIRVAANDRVE